MTRSDPETQAAWTLTYERWEPKEQPLREALCTLGNGYFATRGAAEEADAGGVHYPGTYLACGYNRLTSEVSGRTIANEDLVNWPNWLCLSFRAEGEDWFHVDAVELLDFRQSLDLRRGVLERYIRFRHGHDRETTLVSQRLVHMAQPHLAAIHWALTPENWSGRIEIRSGLDGTVINDGVQRYRALNSRHLEVDELGHEDDVIFLAVQTNQSRLRMVQTARTDVFTEKGPASPHRDNRQRGGRVEQRLSVNCPRGGSLRVEKIAAVYTSRDFAISEPGIAAREAIRRAGCFDELLAGHVRAWSNLWNRADIQTSQQEERPQRILRLHCFHLLQTTSFHSIDLDVGVPSRGWHGEAYRGHIFWDELFIFRFLDLRIPELTRALLMYRYRRLREARHLAREEGYKGAMFPWQSGSSGREESQVLHLNPRSGRWMPDPTHRQRHVGAAIAYNVWKYFHATGDMEFLSFYGAEMLLEIARFWASLATYNAARDRYEIHDIVGPDEFHTRYPDGDGKGLRNNAYTNVMAVWVLRCVKRVLALLSEDRSRELMRELDVGDEELRRFEEVSRKMFVPFHGDGIISQFEGYEELDEFDWEGYRRKYGDIQRLDRILEAEGDTPNRYKASKQADVLMLFYLFSSEELGEIFEGLGYHFDETTIPKNIDYYIQRTSHGSTLSRVVHSWVLARSDRQKAWQLFQEALNSDAADIQGGTTPEGIHLGAMAGTADLVQRCYAGLEIRDEVLWFDPCLPAGLHEISLRVRFRGHWLRIRVNHEHVHVAFEQGSSDAVKIGFGRRTFLMRPGDSRMFSLSA